MAGTDCGLVLPTPVWMSGVSVDCGRNKQAGARPDGSQHSPGGHRSRGDWPAGL